MGRLGFGNYTGNEYCDEVLDLADLQKEVNKQAEQVYEMLSEAQKELEAGDVKAAAATIHQANTWLHDHVIDVTDRYDKKRLRDWLNRNNLNTFR